MRLLLLLVPLALAALATPAVGLPLEQVQKVATSVVVFIPQRCEVEVQGRTIRATYHGHAAKTLAGKPVKLPLSVVGTPGHGLPQASGKWPDASWVVVLFLYHDPLSGKHYVVPGDLPTEFPIAAKLDEIDSVDALISALVGAREPCSVAFLSIAVRNSRDARLRQQVQRLCETLDGNNRTLLERALKAPPFMEDPSLEELFPHLQERGRRAPRTLPGV